MQAKMRVKGQGKDSSCGVANNLAGFATASSFLSVTLQKNLLGPCNRALFASADGKCAPCSAF
jgi:hypothetical protein